MYNMYRQYKKRFEIRVSAYIPSIAQCRLGNIVSSPGTGWCRTGTYSKSMQIRRHCNFICSRQTQLAGQSQTRSTVLCNEDIVSFGRETEAKPPALYIYTAGGQYKRTLPHVCKHEENISLLAPTIHRLSFKRVADTRQDRKNIYMSCSG